MSVRDVLGLEPLAVAQDYLGSTDENTRRHTIAQRIALFENDSGAIMREEINRIFTHEVVRQRVDPFVELCGANALMRRIVDETCRHTYSPGPRRILDRKRDTDAYFRLARDVEMDSKMSQAMHLAMVTNKVFVHPRWLPRHEEVILDILTPDMVHVVPDPDDKLRPLAIIYDAPVNGEKSWIYWDAAETFRIDANRAIQGDIDENVLGELPFVEINYRPRWGTYWDITSGLDLYQAQKSINFLLLLSLKHLKSHGFKQIVIQGETETMEPNQTLDEESALIAPDGTTLSTIDIKGDASHYLALADSIAMSVAANYGLSRERMNSKASEAASDVALMERRREQIAIAAKAERKLLGLMAKISARLPDADLRLPEDAKYKTLDFGELQAQLSLKDTVELWDRLERMDILTKLDLIMTWNREIENETEALAKLKRNIELRGVSVEMERALNAPNDRTNEGPGLDPEENGRRGGQAKEPEQVGLRPGNGVRGVKQGNRASVTDA